VAICDGVRREGMRTKPSRLRDSRYDGLDIVIVVSY
jgi:hypothetical protein